MGGGSEVVDGDGLDRDSEATGRCGMDTLKPVVSDKSKNNKTADHNKTNSQLMLLLNELANKTAD